jgi:hypothetical protein
MPKAANGLKVPALEVLACVHLPIGLDLGLSLGRLGVDFLQRNPGCGISPIRGWS